MHQYSAIINILAEFQKKKKRHIYIPNLFSEVNIDGFEFEAIHFQNVKSLDFTFHYLSREMSITVVLLNITRARNVSCMKGTRKGYQ